MTENEKMAMVMQEFQRIKKNPERIALCAFLRESIDALKEMTAAVKNIPGVNENEDEYYEEDAIVLYAEPGKAAVLVQEDEAIDEIMIQKKVSTFEMHFITEELMAVYPENCAVKNPDGSVFVAGPLYITHPVIGETEDRNIDLSAVDFCEAMAYITTHTVTASIISGFITGYLLEKEE